MCVDSRLFSLFSVCFVAIVEGKQRTVITAFNMPLVSTTAISPTPDESLKGTA